MAKSQWQFYSGPARGSREGDPTEQGSQSKDPGKVPRNPLATTLPVPNKRLYQPSCMCPWHPFLFAHVSEGLRVRDCPPW